MIFVLGSGRSGTSMVARVLHEELGVSMGTRFRQPDGNNPDGFWEDLDFKEHNSQILDGGVALESWRSDLLEILRAREEPWGLKDPRLAYLLGHYLEFCPDATLIRTRRPAHDVAMSMCRCYGWPYVEALLEIKRREELLDLVAGDRAFVINMARSRSAEFLRKEIEQCLITSQSRSY